MSRAVASVSLASLLLSACNAGGPAERLIAYAERDSAGVTIVDNVFDAIPSGWSVDAEPTWTMGGFSAPDEQQLFRVQGGRLLADGRIVIANSGSGEVRIYSQEPSLLASFGGQGDGPGEFQDPTLVAIEGDSAFVFDQEHYRVSVVHLTDGFSRSYEIDWTGTGFPLARGLLADGSLVVGGGMSFSFDEGFPTGVVRPESTFGWVAPDGTTETHVVDLPTADMFAQVSDQGFMARSLPFGRFTQVASTGEGLWLGTADDFTVRHYGAGGTLDRIVTLDPPTVDVTDAMLQAFIDDSADDHDDPEARRRELRQQVRQMPIPDVLPPYQQILVDRLGHLWVQDYRPPRADVPTWTVFDPVGHVVGRLETPARTQLLDVGEDFILGRTLGELDVESLTIWTLRRPQM